MRHLKHDQEGGKTQISITSVVFFRERDLEINKQTKWRFKRENDVKQRTFHTKLQVHRIFFNNNVTLGLSIEFKGTKIQIQQQQQ